MFIDFYLNASKMIVLTRLPDSAGKIDDDEMTILIIISEEIAE